MNTASLRHGDTVLVRVPWWRGHEFEATVDTVLDGEVKIIPPRWCTYQYVTAREVIKRVRRWTPRDALITKAE